VLKNNKKYRIYSKVYQTFPVQATAVEKKKRFIGLISILSKLPYWMCPAKE
jgi:hypothetical protein